MTLGDVVNSIQISVGNNSLPIALRTAGLVQFLRNIRRPLAVVVPLGFLLTSCGGGRSDNPSPVAPSSFSPSVTEGQPSELDWAELGAQLASIGVHALHEALPPSDAAAAALFGTRSHDLSSPPDPVAFTTAYFCCGRGTTGTFITADGTVSPTSSGEAVLTQRLGGGNVRWTLSGNTGPAVLEFSSPGVRLESRLVVSGGRIQRAQEVRMTGDVVYSTSGAQPTAAPIDVVLSYRDLLAGTPAATGTIGSLRPGGRSLPQSPTSPARCGRPREGCPPCTPFSPCGPQSCTGFPACGV